MAANIKGYNPEDPIFWEKEGKKIANRNLWISVPNLLISFSVWYIFSMVIVKLNTVGYNLTPSQIFNLISLPGLFGATLRIFYGLFIPSVGGRNFTIISTLSLLIPVIGIGIICQNPDTPYWFLVLVAVASGFGCANFSSSMATITPFFPKSKQGTALGINGGLGNLGVSVVQFLTPLLMATGIFVAIFGAGQITTSGETIYLQNAAYFWIIPIVLFAVLAYFRMNNLIQDDGHKITLKDQLQFLKNKHTYILMILYIMTFGGFAGFAATFPAILTIKFSGINVMQIIFIGPLVGALIRPFGGMLADKMHKGILSVLIFVGIAFCLYFLTIVNNTFGFIFIFVLLFMLTGLGNGSLFAVAADYFNYKEKGAAIGFISAIGAYGAFLIPQVFKHSLEATNDITNGLYVIFVFNLICMALTYFYYVKNAKTN